MENFTLYFTKGSQKKVRRHLERAHIDSKMCSGLLGTTRTRIQPVIKPSRHFAHFVTRYSTVCSCNHDHQGGLGGEEEGGTHNAFWSKPQDGCHWIRPRWARVTKEMVAKNLCKSLYLCHGIKSGRDIHEKKTCLCKLCSGLRDGRASPYQLNGGTKWLEWGEKYTDKVKQNGERMWRKNYLWYNAGYHIRKVESFL